MEEWNARLWFGFGMQNTNGKYPGRDGKQKAGGGYGASLKDDYRYFYGAHSEWMAEVKRSRVKTTIAKSILIRLTNLESCSSLPLQMERSGNQTSQTHEGHFP